MLALPPSSHNPAFFRDSRTPPSWAVLAGVLLVHALLLFWMLSASTPPPPAVTPPMTGVLLSPASSVGNRKDAPQASAAKAPTQHEKPASLGAETHPRTEKAAPVPAGKAATKDTAGADTGTEKADGKGTQGTPDNASGNRGGAGAFFSPRVNAAGLSNSKPKYPVASRRMAEEGTVALSVHVLATGTVAEVRLKKSSGYSRLDEAAIEAVRKWRYLPARQGDTPVACWHTQAVQFSLTD